MDTSKMKLIVKNILNNSKQTYFVLNILQLTSAAIHAHYNHS